MSNRTQQQIVDALNALCARAVNVVEGTIAGAAQPGGSITFTYRNPVDRQTYTARGIAWNQCVPSKVSAVKLEDGSWLVIGAHESSVVRSSVHTDRRARAQPENRGKVKILFSTIEGDERVFWVGGDRPRPKKICSIPASALVVRAKLDNLSGDLWIMGLKWRDADYHNQSFGVYESNEVNSADEELDTFGSGAMIYVGHGFWWGRRYGRIDNLPPPPKVINVSINYSFYKGEVTSFAGSIDLTLIPNAGSFIENSIVERFLTPISPTLARPFSSEILNIYQPPNESTHYYKIPEAVAVSKDVQFALYSESVKETQSTQGVKTYKLAASETEITLGGDLPNFEDLAINSNLIDSRYFAVNPPLPLVDQPLWAVDIYELGAATTKSTIETSVVYKQEPGMAFHCASYHP